MSKRHTYKTCDDQKVELLKGQSEKIRWTVYENNRSITPVTPTLTLKKPGGADFPTPVVSTAMTVTSAGDIEYAMPSANTTELLENCAGTISYSYQSESFRFGFLFDIVRSRLEMVVTDEDLFAEFPGLKDSGYREISTTTALGTTTTLIDTARLIQPDDYWTGGTIEFPITGEIREVTAFNLSTGTLTFTPALGTAPAAGAKYIVTRSFKKERWRAFQDILERLRNTGRRTSLTLDSHQLRAAHILLTLAKIFRGFVQSETYQELARDYLEMYNRLFKELPLNCPDDESNCLVDNDEQFIGHIGRA